MFGLKINISCTSAIPQENKMYKFTNKTSESKFHVTFCPLWYLLQCLKYGHLKVKVILQKFHVNNSENINILAEIQTFNF
jgi:hypothetical protein